MQFHIRVLESTQENINSLLVGLEYLTNISYVDDTEVFKVWFTVLLFSNSIYIYIYIYIFKWFDLLLSSICLTGLFGLLEFISDRAFWGKPQSWQPCSNRKHDGAAGRSRSVYVCNNETTGLFVSFLVFSSYLPHMSDFVRYKTIQTVWVFFLFRAS